MRNRGSPFAFAGVVALLLAGTTGCEDEYPDLPANPPPSTQPALPVPPPEPGTAREAPHGGVLLPISDGRGFVEWDISSGRLYFLDPQHRPLNGLEHVTLYVSTPDGPRRVELEDYKDAQYPDACSTAPGNWLRNARTVGVIRFTLAGQAYRVHLASGEAKLQPTSAAPAPSPRPGPGVRV